jgi:hypothetical protein
LQPDSNNNNNNPSTPSGGGEQKCGAAVNSSNNSTVTCQNDLWDPTGDDNMHCFAYGGIGDPCHLNNNNDINNGQNKNPTNCLSDTFYLWDEPDTQGKSYEWAGRTWLEYSRQYSNEINEMRSRSIGTKFTSPLLKAGEAGTLNKNLNDFFSSCGPPCYDTNDPAYIDIIAVNGFCGDFNGPAGCRGGAAFIYNEAISISKSFRNPVYITNWSRLQTNNPDDQIDAIDAIDEFFPSSNNDNDGVVKRVYWFGATDFGGDSSNNFLTTVLSDGNTLGELWRNKCESL